MWRYNYSYQDELYHWGIKGQKWGVRRYQNRDGTLTPAGKIRYSDDGANSKSKNVKDMSDQELRDRVNRLNMEKAYSNLTTSKSNFKKAMAVAATAAAVMGTVDQLYSRSKNMIKIGEDVINLVSSLPIGAWDKKWLY